MGKKSRRRKPTTPNHDAMMAVVAPTSNNGANPTPNIPNSADISHLLDYPSDGPSDVELLQTTSLSLQTKLDQLTELGMANDRAGFVREFVPLDLSIEDQQAYLEDLTVAPEAQGQWTNLIAEIAAIRSGRGVDRIEGDQTTRAKFYFKHPLLQQCDREVSFVYYNDGVPNDSGGGEWRAEG
eukprot:scaffold1377_cov126-Cylindrotheca_fusiformis.AAC.32